MITVLADSCLPILNLVYQTLFFSFHAYEFDYLTLLLFSETRSIVAPLRCVLLSTQLVEFFDLFLPNLVK